MDERFKDIPLDPKFKPLRKEKKLPVDERFHSMYTDEKFQLKDKRNPESELSSSSDESDSENEYEEEPTINFDWQPLDHDAETAEATSKRLAIQNLDWDHLDIKDIYILVNSIRPPLSVKMYVSEFGKERLRDEEIHGPKEIVEAQNEDEAEEQEYKMLKQKMDTMKNKGANSFGINEYEDADEEMDPQNEEIREKIRKYQLNRMKYYYAIVEFDSVESAEVVYKELDGMEVEGSSLELDLRFVPDDIEFDDQDLKSTCDKVPDLSTYTAPQFINSALQQTNVKFTWDETDIKRQEKLKKAYTQHELDKDDLDAYLGSETESEEEDQDDDGVSVATANKYKMLIASLDEEAEKKKKIDVDVEWDNHSDVESGDHDDNDDEAEDEDDDEDDDSEEEKVEDDVESPSEASEIEERPVKNKRRGPKRKATKDKVDDDEGDGDLDLLVMDMNNSAKKEFEFDPDDERFSAIYKSGLYNIDPSNPNFKRTKAIEMIAEKKRQKRLKQS